MSPAEIARILPHLTPAERRELDELLALPQVVRSAVLTRPKPEWAKAFDAPSRYKAAYGGRASGKSHEFAERLLERCVAKKTRAVCIREVQTALRESVRQLIIDKIEHFKLGSQFQALEAEIRTPFDGLIIFRGMQAYNAETIKSLEGYDIAWVEEAQTLSATSLRMLRPTIRSPGSELWFTWNPRHDTDAVDDFLRGVKPPANAIIRPVNWSDNPYLPDEMRQEMADDRERNPAMASHVWDGGYEVVTEGAYYAPQLTEARAQNRVGKLSADPLMTLRAVWDIGGTGAKADATAIWIVQYIGRELRFLDYYEAVGQPLATHVGWLRDKGYEKALCVLPHDGAAHEKITDTTYEGALRVAGFEVKVIPNQGAGAAMQRVEAARRLFPQMYFDEERCVGGLKAIGSYHEKRDPKRGIGLGPDHDWSSHGSDAFGLAAVAYEPPRQARKLSYSSAGVV